MKSVYSYFNDFPLFFSVLYPVPLKPLYKLHKRLKLRLNGIRTEIQNRTEIYYDLDIYSLSSFYTNIAIMQATT